MGHIVHHAIIVTSWNSELLEKTRERAIECGNLVTEVTNSNINGYVSFCVVPDGSKSGWSASEEGDQARDDLKEWIGTQAYSDGSSALQWVEVQYGDDISSEKAFVVDDGNQQIMRNPAAHESGIV